MSFRPPLSAGAAVRSTDHLGCRRGSADLQSVYAPTAGAKTLRRCLLRPLAATVRACGRAIDTIAQVKSAATSVAFTTAREPSTTVALACG